MAKSERVVQYTTEEILEMRRRGEDRTDWAKVDALTEEELEASIDFEEEGEIDWSTVQSGIPGPQQQFTLWLDQEVIDWFTAQGIGYRSQMNAVLRSYVDAQKG
ncbi:MAG: BrnA antitoxin family protein [Chloroflexia bacterium]|nr:BrnA antitoxin family protein [Chloroflexia bacterium]